MKKMYKNNKIMKAVMMTIRICVAVIFFGFLLVVCLQRFSNNKISFFNFRMFTVVTGSMAPKYNVGDVLISRDVEASTIKVGDTISYHGAAGDFKGKVITHQVVGIEKDEYGEYTFRAKGLTNLIEDPIVYENQLYGIVIYKSVILSFIYKVVGTLAGFFVLIIVPLMFVVGSEMIIILLDKEEKRRDKQINN